MRKPDHVVMQNGGVYLNRWWIVPRNRWFNVYLHEFRQSDDDRALHDHPWIWNLSLVLRGGYLEHKVGGLVKKRRRFLPYFRWGRAPHRVELEGGGPVWTLFLTGMRVREWGFLCEKGWMHWEEFGKKDGCD